MFQDSQEWMLWQARNAVGEPQPTIAAPMPIVIVQPTPRRRKRHWTGSFQIKFSHWLKGDGERPCNLGYTRRMLMRHLERQFSKGMGWENYAAFHPFKTTTGVWVVDHIVPKYLFDQDDVLHAYALTNLRPLWMVDNARKGKMREHLL